MESADKAVEQEPRSAPTAIPTDSPGEHTVDRHAVGHPEHDAVTQAEETPESLRARAKTIGDTPFDRRSISDVRIDWGGLVAAFMGGIGANFFLGFFLLFMQHLLGTILNGPGVMAILTGLFVLVHILVAMPLLIRRMTIAFWAGLLCGYAAIWILVRPLLAGS